MRAFYDTYASLSSLIRALKRTIKRKKNWSTEKKLINKKFESLFQPISIIALILIDA
jgi:hypothetical protein